MRNDTCLIQSFSVIFDFCKLMKFRKNSFDFILSSLKKSFLLCFIFFQINIELIYLSLKQTESYVHQETQKKNI